MVVTLILRMGGSRRGYAQPTRHYACRDDKLKTTPIAAAAATGHGVFSAARTTLPPLSQITRNVSSIVRTKEYGPPFRRNAWETGPPSITPSNC